ncbi:hypothetical protein Tco_0038359 [Tanacetum coccineum]
MSMLLKYGCETMHGTLISLKIAYSMMKEKPSKKLTTRNLVDLFKEGDIEQQLRVFIKGTTQILHTKNEGASVSVMPLLTYLNLGLGELAHTKLTVKLADRTLKYPKGIAKNVLVCIGFCALDPSKTIFVYRPSKIDVYKRKITLRTGEERIIFKSVKPGSSLTKRVYMLSLRERMELDLEARLMGETLVINRSLDPLNGDYIELNDLNEPFELRRNQGDDLMPTIEEGEVIEEFKTRDDELDTEIDDYPILENMDAYRDEGMGDVIFGEPFLREVGIKARRFEGMIP